MVLEDYFIGLYYKLIKSQFYWIYWQRLVVIIKNYSLKAFSKIYHVCVCSIYNKLLFERVLVKYHKQLIFGILVFNAKD